MMIDEINQEFRPSTYLFFTFGTFVLTYFLLSFPQIDLVCQQSSKKVGVECGTKCDFVTGVPRPKFWISIKFIWTIEFMKLINIFVS